MCWPRSTGESMKPQIYAVAVTILILPQLIGCSKPVSTPVPPAVKKLLPVRWIAAVDLEDLQSVEAALDRRDAGRRATGTAKRYWG